jgi:cytochrome P450
MAKIKIIDDIIYDIIDKKRKNESYGNDLVTMLMEARDEDTGEGMPDKQLRDELLTIYVAGHETSAYCLSWTFYELMRHPDIYQKIKEEAAAVVKDGKIGADGLKGLTYTRAVVNESMRLFPPAYLVSRECGEDDEIDGVKINKGDVILMSIYGLHRNPKHWPQPLSFRPERFLETTEATKHYHIPFGAGPRMCIGNHFAMMEITLILAKVALNLDLEWVIGQKIEMQPLVTLKPKHGILLEKV